MRGIRVREPAPGKDSSLPGKPRNPDESLHAHDIHLAYGPVFSRRRNVAGKPSPVSEHRESDDPQSKDAHRDDRFRCPIHRCLRQASGWRDASLACEPLFTGLRPGSHSGHFFETGLTGCWDTVAGDSTSTCSDGRKSLSTIRGMSFLVIPMSSSSLSSRF